MHISHTIPGLLAALVCVSGAGCKQSKSNSPSAPAASSALSPDTVARVHWLGKKRLGTEASAYYFMRLWGLPESRKLEAQTLDKLTLAPWRFLRGEAAVATAPAALLRPLLDDILQAETYFEIRQATNQPGELAIAIRLDHQRAGLWRTNLVTVLGSLSSIQTMVLRDGGQGWSVTQNEVPNLIELTRVGEWTVLGAAQKKNELLGEIVARIQRDHAPFSTPGTNFWLNADFDLKRVRSALGLGWKLADDLPRISVAVTGDGGNVITRGELTFAKPLQLELEPWTIPTRLIQGPLASFTAVRGIKPWLASAKIWNDFQLGAPPNQFYFWALDGAPMQTYFAAPLPNASNQVHALTDVLVRKTTPWLASHGVGNFARSPDTNGAIWVGLPYLTPFIKSVGVGDDGLVLGGSLSSAGVATNHPLSAGLLQDVLGRTNLVYFDWELTGLRIQSCLYLGQIFRVALRRPQLLPECASALWMNNLVPRLHQGAMVITRTRPDQLTFHRKSAAGFTAPELHLLADWLESPQFPRGLHTFLAPPDAPTGGTSSPSAPAKP